MPIYVHVWIFIYDNFSNRSIGLAREAEMIEQQLKVKQGGGQPNAAQMVSGKTFYVY